MRIRQIVLAGVAGLTLHAWAADEVTDTIQAAYGPYRAALFRTNSNSQPEAQQAIASARQSWQAVSARFAAKPPPPYDRDPVFSAALDQVAAIYAKADLQVRDGQLAQAHETLEEARDVIALLRQRNGVVTYSDHMNAYHSEMEHVIGEGAKTLDGPQQAMLLMARVGVLEYLARRLRSEAPATLVREPEFGPALQAVEGSVVALRSAVLSQDAPAIRQAIDKLKGPYSRMFLKFG